MTKHEVDNDRIVLGLLESVERDSEKSQRLLAQELGIALGLVNAYLKRCVKKGLVKVREAPARRYAYYLTPDGFAEKSRLTISYLSYSFGFFRVAKADCQAVLDDAASRGFEKLVLAGCSDLAEIATICANDGGFAIVAAVDPQATNEIFVGIPVLRDFSTLTDKTLAVVVTDLINTQQTTNAAVEHFGRSRLFVPALLAGRLSTAANPTD